MRKYVTTLLYDDGGTYLEVYTDDDGASGYGDNAMVGRWYGSRAECEAIARTPAMVPLRPLGQSDLITDPFDAACERRYE